jgi:hypothetical protein
VTIIEVSLNIETIKSLIEEQIHLLDEYLEHKDYYEDAEKEFLIYIKKIDDVYSSMLVELINSNDSNYFNDRDILYLYQELNISKKIIKLILNSNKNIEEILGELYSKINIIEIYIKNKNNLNQIKKLKDYYKGKYKELEGIVEESNILVGDLRNKTIKDLYDEESKSFKKVSKYYELSFYFLMVFMFLYFFGVSLHIEDINMGVINLSFQNRDNIPDIQFYIQKLSILILSTTLAAFLLKRSFMNRRLADESYRTAKELAGLPRYMESLPLEMQNKIRFDLAYKYFGNGIHNESYTSGENLMHENIKANTDFIKAIKDLSPKVEIPKTDAPKEDKAPKDAA